QAGGNGGGSLLSKAGPDGRRSKSPRQYTHQDAYVVAVANTAPTRTGGVAPDGSKGRTALARKERKASTKTTMTAGTPLNHTNTNPSSAAGRTLRQRAPASRPQDKPKGATSARYRADSQDAKPRKSARPASSRPCDRVSSRPAISFRANSGPRRPVRLSRKSSVPSSLSPAS